MKFILIFGPPAVGKMTVGKALAEQTGFKLFHNHMSLELVNQFFDFGTPPFRRLDRLIRFGIFEEVAKSNLEGFIFTLVWAFNEKADEAYVDEIIKLFQQEGAQTHLVELKADLAVRLKRNRHEDRLAQKPSKRIVEFSESLLLHDEEKYRLNTLENEFPERNILTIDNTLLKPEEVALKIKTHFNL